MSYPTPPCGIVAWGQALWHVNEDGSIIWKGRNIGTLKGGWLRKPCSPRRGWWSWKHGGPGVQAEVWDFLRPQGIEFINLDTGEALRLSAEEFEAQRVEDTLNPADGPQYFVAWLGRRPQGRQLPLALGVMP